MTWNPGGGGRPRGPGAPDLEDLVERTLREGRARLKRLFPGGFGGSRGFALIAGVLLVVWLLTGLYIVDPDEQGVELLFSAWDGTTEGPGLHYHLPVPIDFVPRDVRIAEVVSHRF